VIPIAKPLIGDEEIEEVPLIVNHELKQIYVTGAIGGHTAHDFRLLFFNEITKEKNDNSIGLVRSIDYEVIMSHRAVRELYSWLEKHIKKYDEQMKELKNEEGE